MKKEQIKQYTRYHTDHLFGSWETTITAETRVYINPELIESAKLHVIENHKSQLKSRKVKGWFRTKTTEEWVDELAELVPSYRCIGSSGSVYFLDYNPLNGMKAEVPKDYKIVSKMRGEF